MGKSWLRVFLSVLFFGLIFSAAKPALRAGDEAESAKLIVGETKIFSTHNPTRVVIGNPAVVDVEEVTNSDIKITAKAAGKTTLVYWDNFGEQSFTIKVIQEDIDEVKRRVDNLLSKINIKGVSTKAEEDENKVYIMGKVKDPQAKEKINLVLGPLKDKTINLIEIAEEESVVNIDVQVLELDKGASSSLGFKWPGQVNIFEQGSPAIASTTSQVGTVQGTAALQTAIPGTPWGTLFKVLDVSRDAFTLTINALVQEGKARILSRPRLACQSGKEAELLVGGEKPTFTTSSQNTISTSTEVTYKEYGIKLKIRPTVTEEKRIKLVLNVEVSEVQAAETIGAANAPTAKAYPLTKRNVSTELFLNDGQTLAIGGLMKHKTEENYRKVPFVSEVPILGLFFRNKNTSSGGDVDTKSDTELFIALTPNIIFQEPVAQQPKNVQPPKADSSQEQSRAVAVPENLRSYVNAVQTKILNAVTYPAQAKDMGWEGNLKLSLNIGYDGSLKGLKVVNSSGYNILDNSALDAARALAPYPPFPPQIEAQELNIEVPISYKKD